MCDRHRHGSRYKEEGLQRHVQAVILVHHHSHPHVLLLQGPNDSFNLPGGWLNPGEDGEEFPFVISDFACSMISFYAVSPEHINL